MYNILDKYIYTIRSPLPLRNVRSKKLMMRQINRFITVLINTYLEKKNEYDMELQSIKDRRKNIFHDFKCHLHF